MWLVALIARVIYQQEQPDNAATAIAIAISCPVVQKVLAKYV